MLQTIITILTSLPMMVSLFWLIFLIIERNSINTTKWWLIAFFFSTFLLYTGHYFYFAKHSTPAIEIIYIICNQSVFPLFYGYIISLTNSHMKKSELLLFAPAVITTILFPILYLFDMPEILSYMSIIARCLFAVLVIYVWYKGEKQLRTYNHELANYYSDTRSHILTPLHTLFVLMSVISLLAMTLNIIGREFFSSNTIVIIPALIMASLLYALGYITQSINTQDIDIASPDEISADQHQVQFEQLNTDLVRIITDKKLYLDPKLTIHDLARQLGTNRTYLSNLINHHYNTNFVTFINQYRVEEAKKILSNPNYSDKKALHDAIDFCGFQSEQSFYRIFKQHTKKTPLEWRKSIFCTN